LFAAPLLAALVGNPTLAPAQPSEQNTAAARALFDEGRSLASEDRWSEAADRFRRALDLRASPAIRYNLAVALEHEGKLVDAAEQLQAAVREAGPRDAARGAAEELLATVEPRIARLTIVVGDTLAGAEVSLDGRTLPTADLGVAMPVDPGRHVVRARLGAAEASREIDLADGADERLSAPVPAPRTSATAPHGSPEIVPPPRPPGARSPGHSEPAGGISWPFVLGGVGLVGAGLALDVAPSSSRNGELDALDLVPLGLYAGGAVLAALGFLE
jgi:hypothetical protein